ncbi:MAG: PIN domain-containing protein [Deltaproteobacteria bacterium]|nr:PIN domain-containing protein [Deltaproteobacteria bacterium]
MVIAVDTNLLVYAHRSRAPEHEAAREALQLAAEDPDGWGIPLPCLAEFWTVVTHPRSIGRPSTPEEAAGFVRALIRSGGATIWQAVTGFSGRLLRAAEQASVSGARMFDLQIALLAAEAGAHEIWTHDRHFCTVPGLTLHDPIVAGRQ